MGSCENSLEVHEPLQQADVQQHLCAIKNSVSELEARGIAMDHNVGPIGYLDECLELAESDSAACVSSSDSRNAESADGVIGLVTEVECRNERKTGIDDCNSVLPDGTYVEKEASCSENNRSINSLDDCEKSLELVPECGFITNCNQQDEQENGWNVQRDMEEKTGSLNIKISDTCDLIMPSFDSEMAAESRAVDALPRIWVEQNKPDTRAILDEGMVFVENKPVGLAWGDSVDCSQIDHLSNYFEQGNQKNEQIVNGLSAEEFTEVVKENIIVPPVTESASHNQLPSSQDVDSSSELMPEISSLEKSVMQEENKDDGSVKLPSDGGVMEKKNSLSIRVRCNDEMPAESASSPGFPRDGRQQNDLEIKTSDGVAFESAAQGKIDAVAVGESDICTQKSLDGIATPKHSSIIGSLGSTYEMQDDQKNDTVANHLSAETPTDILKKSDADECIQAYPSLSCQRTLENLAIADLQGNCANEQRSERSEYEHFMVAMPGILEEESDVTTEIKFESPSKTCCVEGDAYDLKDGSPQITPNSGLSCLHFGKEVLRAIYSGSAVDCSEQIGNEGKSVAGSCSSKTTCLDIGSLSSRRSSRIRKSSKKSQTRRAAKKCRNKAELQELQIFKAERRKRSCLSKPARASNWGLLGNITQLFGLSNGLGLNANQSHGPRKIKVVQGDGKRFKGQASGSTQRSIGNKHSSTGNIRLKVIVRKEVGQNRQSPVVPEVTGTSASDILVSGFQNETYPGSSFEFPNFVDGVEDKIGEKVYPNASISDLHVQDKEFEGTVICPKSTVDAVADYLGVPSHADVDTLGEATGKRYAEPGTSPDSEVINLVPESQVNATCQDDLHDAFVTSSKTPVATGVVNSGKKGKKKDRCTHANDSSAEDASPGMAGLNSVKTTKKHGGRQGKDDGFLPSQILISSVNATVSRNSSCHKESSEEQLHSFGKTELGVSEEDLLAESGVDFALRLSESPNSDNLLCSTKSKSQRSQIPKKPKGSIKRRSKASDKSRSKSANSRRQRENEQMSVDKDQSKENNEFDQAICKLEDNPETGNCIADVDKNNPADLTASIDVTNLDMASNDAVVQQLPVDNAWVRCDDCHKWRRIPVALVDSIGQSNCKWICKENMDKAFADCSIAQEKSNAEINAELGLSDADEDAYDVPTKNKGLESKRTIVSKEHEFTRISTNQFLHRSRKKQTIDEIMVCYCKLPAHGGLGCGDECLNRMLNIECVQGTCPCGDKCSNQQFQKRNYAKMEWTRCGKKGFGLQLEEDISTGQFLIEYVGEVLDMHTYEARQREYASKGHKHFYFMTLNSSEVIDASAKGNLGRFINHSCDPNCRTEKWVVNGEICIGLFALRDIKKGEEVTFDYNYVRVVGAAAKRCYCGSPQCRGYIGGDPTSSEVIDQVDSDEEFPEPVMLDDGVARDGLKGRIPRISSSNGVEVQVAEAKSKDRNRVDNSTAAAGKLEVGSEIEDTMSLAVSAISKPSTSMEMDDLKGNISHSVEVSAEADAMTCKSESSVKQEISKEERGETSATTMLNKLSPDDGMASNKKSKSGTAEEKRVFVKSRFLIKTSHDSGSGKKGKFTNPVVANKVQMLPSKSHVFSVKHKRSAGGTSNGRFEAVEEKLNELLDADGGISKRKDAPKVYLKLLLLTAASGASGNGEAIQSNRDLSMILDALLKTKSKVVLIDIINKNGLRMLHNMIKQYRWDFKKIPILRKLLKVLEYLASREILTHEHINGGPPCRGMESFRESMLVLTEHDDKQVYQIARNFRNKWIPQHGRKYRHEDRDNGRVEFHRGSMSNRVSVPVNHSQDLAVRPTEATDCTAQSKLATASSMDSAVREGCSPSGVCGVTRTRKRKSRWDQPAEEKPSLRSFPCDEQMIHSGLLQQSESHSRGDTSKAVLDNIEKRRENTHCPHCALNYSQLDEASCADDKRQSIQIDIPPGFSSLNQNLISPFASSSEIQQENGHLFSPVDVAVAHPQKKFNSRMSVSYGIPFPIVQQYGSPQDGTVEGWTVAPGMPFYPFPPLPPFPQHKKETPSSAVSSMVVNGATEEDQEDRHDLANENNPSTTGVNQPDMDLRGENAQQAFKRAKESSHDLGKRYFRQQKWNKAMPQWIPQWIPDRDDGSGHLDTNVKENTYCSQDLSSRVEKPGNCINQQNST